MATLATCIAWTTHWISSCWFKSSWAVFVVSFLVAGLGHRRKNLKARRPRDSRDSRDSRCVQQGNSIPLATLPPSGSSGSSGSSGQQRSWPPWTTGTTDLVLWKFREGVLWNLWLLLPQYPTCQGIGPVSCPLLLVQSVVYHDDTSNNGRGQVDRGGSPGFCKPPVPSLHHQQHPAPPSPRLDSCPTQCVHGSSSEPSGWGVEPP